MCQPCPSRWVFDSKWLENKRRRHRGPGLAFYQVCASRTTDAHGYGSMTKVFIHSITAGLWVIAIVVGCVSMTARAVSHGEAIADLPCPSDVAVGPLCDLSAHGPATVTDDNTEADDWNVAAAVAAPGERCEPAPGFFLSRVQARRVRAKAQHLYRGSEATRAALVARIHVAGRRFGVAPHLGEGIAWTESRFDPTARSSDGLSVGAFQLTRVTAAAMRRRLAGVAEDLPLHDEVTLGIGYLRYLSGLFARPTILDEGGNATIAVGNCTERWRFAIAAYNAGEGRVAAGQRRAAAAGLDPTHFDNVRPYLPQITRRYVDSVLTFAAWQIAAEASHAS